MPRGKVCQERAPMRALVCLKTLRDAKKNGKKTTLALSLRVLSLRADQLKGILGF